MHSTTSPAPANCRGMDALTQWAKRYGAPLLSTLALCVTAPAQAQGAYPNKLVRLILPFPTGGSTDAMARLIALKLGEMWKQSVIVDSKPGGNSTIGTAELVRSAADGYTLLYVNNDFVLNPTLMPNLPYDTLKDFAPVGTLARSDYVMVVNTAVPANSVQELIALAKAKPDTLNAATTGTGSPQHIAAELFNVQAGVKILSIPYKGIAASTTDLLGNTVQIAFSNPMSFAPLIKQGKVKPIAISGDKRSPVLPNVPTFAESGMPNYRATNWFGIVMHGRTPAEITAKVSADITRVHRTTDFDELMLKAGIEPYALAGEQFATLIRDDIERYRNLIKTANIKLQ